MPPWLFSGMQKPNFNFGRGENEIMKNPNRTIYIKQIAEKKIPANKHLNIDHMKIRWNTINSWVSHGILLFQGHVAIYKLLEL